MGFRQNYTGVREAFGIPDEDTYHVMIVQAKSTKSKKGDPMVNFKMEIIEGAVTKRVFSGQFLFSNRVFIQSNEQVSGFNKHFLKVIGEPYDEEFTVEPDHWVGKQLKVTVVHEMYEGKEQAKVKKVDYLEGGAIPPVDFKNT